MNAAEFLKNAIDRSTKSQMQIATESGFSRPNIITMLKQGKTRIPIARIPALAKSLEIPCQTLMTVCLSEYDPEMLDALCEAYGIHTTPAPWRPTCTR